jgi:hypothetical protein
MGKKKEDMTEEERESARTRMAELRQIAAAKISARAKDKRDTEDLVRKAKRDKDAYDREQATKTLKELEEAKKRDAERAVKVTEPEVEPEPLHVDEMRTPMPPPPKATKKKLVVHDSDSDDDAASYKAFLKEKLKSKYETKYRMKYAPTQGATAMPMMQNPIQETARDVLKSKVNEEVRKMAMASLFGGGGGGWA